MPTYPELVAADGAIHYWRLNDAPGSFFAADSLGTADGAISAGLNVTLGVPGALPDDTAMHFNGAGRIDVSHAIAFANNFSVECWFKLDGPGAGTILPLIATQPLPGQGQFWLEVLDGGMTLRAQIADTPTTSTYLIADTARGLDGLVDGQWHHLVWVFPLNLPNVAVYLDGAPLAVNKPSTLFYATAPAWFAFSSAPTGQRYHVGGLDEIAFYPIALTAAQVATHYRLVVPSQILVVPQILIENVDKTTMTRAPGNFRIEYQLGSRGQAELEVRDYDSFATAYRPQLDHFVKLNPNLFDGAVFTVSDQPLGNPGVGTVTAMQAMDQWRWASRRRVTEHFPAGETLKQIVTLIVGKYLGTYSILLDAAMADGPIMGEIIFDYNTVEDAFNRLAVLTNWIYRLTPRGVAGPFNYVQWFPVGAKQRSIIFSAANDNIIGPVTWTRTQEATANRLIIRYGSGLVDKSEDFVGDGVTRSFPLKWKLAAPGWIKYPGVLDQEQRTQSWPGVGAATPDGKEYYQTDYPALQEYQDVWPNAANVTPPLCGFPVGWGPAQLPGGSWFWDATIHCLVHDQTQPSNPCAGGSGVTPASVTVTIAPYKALNQEGVGAEGAQLTDLYKWHYDAASNSLVSNYPNPPAAGLHFTFEYQVQYPLDVTVEDASDFIVHGIIEELRTEPTIFEEAEAITFGRGLLKKRTITPRQVTITTRAGHDFLPGDTVFLDVPSRTLPHAPWLITNVVYVADDDQNITTTLMLLEGSEAQGSWIDFWRKVLGVSGQTPGAGSGAPSPALRATGNGSLIPPPPGPTIASIVAGKTALDSSGIYVSPLGTGLYAAPNAVRWSTAYAMNEAYRTAIWRSDQVTPNPIKVWNFDNIQGIDTVVAETIYKTKIDGLPTFTSYGEAVLKQIAKNTVGETFQSLLAHRYDGTFDTHKWCGVWTWTGTQEPDPIAAFGIWKTAVEPQPGATPAYGFSIRNGIIDVYGLLRFWSAGVIDSTHTIRYAGELTTNQLALFNNIFYDGSFWNLPDTTQPGIFQTLKVAGGQVGFEVWWAPAGSNPRTPIRLLGLDPNGLTVNNFFGNGSGITNINGGNITVGTIPPGAISVTGPPKLLGRGSSGAGPMEEITLGAGLTMTGTVLSASGGGGSGADNEVFIGAADPGAPPYELWYDTDEVVIDPAAPTGNVVGPATSIDNDLALFSGATGKVLKDSGVLLSNVALRNAVNTFTAGQAISAASPNLIFQDTAAPANAKLFNITNTAQQLLFDALDDTAAQVSRPLMLDRAGNVTVGKALYASGYPGVVVSAGVGEVRLYEQNQPANNKMVRLLAWEGKAQIWTADDASNMQGKLALDRVGNFGVNGSIECFQTLFLKDGANPQLAIQNYANYLRFVNTAYGQVAYMDMNGSLTLAGSSQLGGASLTLSAHLYVAGAVYERSRQFPMGYRQGWTPTFSSDTGATLSGSIACSFTVVGQYVLVTIYAANFNLPSATAYVAISGPGGFLPGLPGWEQNTVRVFWNGVAEVGFFEVVQNFGLRVWRLGQAAIPAGGSNYILGQVWYALQ